MAHLRNGRWLEGNWTGLLNSCNIHKGENNPGLVWICFADVLDARDTVKFNDGAQHRQIHQA